MRVIKNGFGAEIFGLEFANGVSDDGYHFIEDAVKKVRLRLWKKSSSAEIYSMDLLSYDRQNWSTRPILTWLANSVTSMM
jgi:hypothetical protein